MTMEFVALSDITSCAYMMLVIPEPLE